MKEDYFQSILFQIWHYWRKKDKSVLFKATSAWEIEAVIGSVRILVENFV